VASPVFAASPADYSVISHPYPADYLVMSRHQRSVFLQITIVPFNFKNTHKVNG
jgi:hypothetical protein